MVEQYVAADDADPIDVLYDFAMIADAVRGQLPQIDARPRSQPIALPFPVNRRHEVRVSNLEGNYAPVDDATHDEPYLRYSIDSQVSDDELRIAWNLRTTRDFIAAEEASDFAAVASKINNTSAVSYNLRSTSVTNAPFVFFLGMAVFAAPLLFFVFFIVYRVRKIHAEIENG